MYACGLRIGEAVGLRPEQVDARQGVLRIIGKGNKERLVPLPVCLLQAMRRVWAKHRNPQWVFATEQRQQGEWVFHIGAAGKIGPAGEGGDWDAATLPGWLTKHLPASAQSPAPATAPAAIGTGPYYAAWVHIDDEQKTTMEGLAKGLAALQIAASRALPEDSTLTIFIVLDSLAKALAAGK
jgi:hypothetical protein